MIMQPRTPDSSAMSASATTCWYQAAKLASRVTERACFTWGLTLLGSGADKGSPPPKSSLDPPPVGLRLPVRRAGRGRRLLWLLRRLLLLLLIPLGLVRVLLLAADLGRPDDGGAD